MKAAIDSSKVKGEAGTGYEGPNGKGPFRCGNCTYFRMTTSSCGQSTMVKLSEQPRTADGRVKVDADGCCEYVNRKASERFEAFKEAQDARRKQ